MSRTNWRTPEEQADALVALLDALQIERVAVQGVSGGGPSAIHFAARHPDRISALLLTCAVSGGYSKDEVTQTAERVMSDSDLLGFLQGITQNVLRPIIRTSSRVPTALACTTWPRRATTVTTPGIERSSTTRHGF